MSVVNTMLRELAARQGNEQPATLPPQTVTVSAPASSRLPWWFAVMLGLALLIFVWRWLQAGNAEPSAPAESASAALSVVNTQGTAEPVPLAPETSAPDSSYRVIANESGKTAGAFTASAVEPQPQQAPVSIGWELVDREQLASDDSALAVFDDAGEVDAPTPDAGYPEKANTTAVTNTAAMTASEPSRFERAPSQQTVAEQLAHWRQLAERAIASGDRSTGRTAIDAGLRIKADDPALQLLQIQWLAEQQPAAAEQYAQQRLQQQPAHWQLRQWLGTRQLQAQQIQAAYDTLRQNAPALTDAPDYHAVLALAEQQTGSHEAAALRYRQLHQLQPDHGRHLAGLALSLESLGDSTGAIAAWQRALRDPALPSALALFGQQRLQRLGTAPTSQVSP